MGVHHEPHGPQLVLTRRKELAERRGPSGPEIAPADHGAEISRDYAGNPFILFGTAHLIGLALVAIVCLVIYFLRRRFSPHARALRLGKLATCEQLFMHFDLF